MSSDIAGCTSVDVMKICLEKAKEKAVLVRSLEIVIARNIQVDRDHMTGKCGLTAVTERTIFELRSYHC